MEKSRKELLAEEYASQTAVTAGSAELNEFKPAVTADKTKVVDRALDETMDLIGEERMRPWYAKQAYRLGAGRYLGMASDARRGRAPARLFSYMLKRA